MQSLDAVEFRFADHVARDRARRFLRAAGRDAGAAERPQALLTAMLALRLDAALAAQVRALLAARARPLVILLGDGSQPPDPACLRDLFDAGIWSVMADPRDERLIEALRSSVAGLGEVEQALDSPAVRAHLVGGSSAWRALLRELAWVAKFSCAPLLLLGETGTGKELLARLIHTLDRRADKKELVVVDCTTLSGELAGSELFGHQRGAYTGAHAQRVGAAQLAHGGTLFLDEVGELQPAVQAQLLRLLQEGAFKPVGGSQWERASFRLVCATHRDLEAEVAAGRFRQDLYFRIAGWVARVPPLRERGADLRVLADHFLAEFDCPQGIDDELARTLAGHRFAGNVRELRQLMMQAAMKHRGPLQVSLGDLPGHWFRVAGDAAATGEAARTCAAPAESTIVEWVRAGAGLRDITQRAGDIAIREALQAEGQHVGRAARRLGITERAIQLRRAQRPTDGVPEPGRRAG